MLQDTVDLTYMIKNPFHFFPRLVLNLVYRVPVGNNEPILKSIPINEGLTTRDFVSKFQKLHLQGEIPTVLVLKGVNR